MPGVPRRMISCHEQVGVPPGMNPRFYTGWFSEAPAAEFQMSAAKSQLFQRINEYLQEMNDPYQKFAIWPFNSLDETATPFLILDRDVHFWRPPSKMIECMQRNHHFFKKCLNVLCKISTFLWKPIASQATTPTEDSWHDSWVLLTKWPLHFWFLIGVSVSEAATAAFSNLCSEITTFSQT